MFPMDWITLRCRTDEDSNCLLWNQGTNSSGAPVATTRLPDGKRPTMQLRRVVWEHRHGAVPPGMVVTVTCGHVRCLMHLELVTKAEVVRREWAKQEGRARLTAAATKASRARAKMDIQRAREVRGSNETLEQVAARMGISTALASMIRRGERWKEDANPFAGLGA